MTIRSILAIALGSSMTMAFTTDAAQPEEELAAAACPGLTANITFNDYDGTHLVRMCVAPLGLSISAGVVNLRLYDNESDGLFHNGFDAAPDP
jgi:hypothetical protein